MKTKMVAAGIGLVLVTFLASCQTVQQNPGASTGVGIGAATGAIAGGLIGRGAGGAIIGGLLGGLAGGAIGHYAYDVPRTREETARAYNYQPSHGTILRIENASVRPSLVRPGDTVDLRMTYAVLTPSPDVEVPVTEKRIITYRGEVVGEPEVRMGRLGGTYASTVPLRLPPNAQLGEYKVREIVETANTRDVKEVYFTVE